MARPTRALGLVALVGCRIAFDPVVAPDASCVQSWYADLDGDGHGDANDVADACEQPEGRVATNDDCDDRERFRAPGRIEICDALDNDCDPGTAETCAAGCQPVKRPTPDDAATYLFCSATSVSWNAAELACTAEGFHLAQIDTASEDTWIAGEGDTQFGALTSFSLGGTDAAVEGVWLWVNGPQFWQGGVGGTTVSGRSAGWDPGLEPSAGGPGEDCSEMKDTGGWNDIQCTTQQPFVCKRYP